MAKQKKNKYKSNYEVLFAKYLEKNSIPFDYEKKKLEYVVTHSYKVDFSFKSNIIIETKGYFTAQDRTKMLSVKKQYPELDIRMLFMHNNKIHKSSPTRYGDWCDKHGFKWTVSPLGEIPANWLSDLLRPPSSTKEPSKKHAQDRFTGKAGPETSPPSKGVLGGDKGQRRRKTRLHPS